MLPSGNMRPRTVVVRFQPRRLGAHHQGVGKRVSRGTSGRWIGAPKKARFLAYWDAWALAWDGVRQSGKALKTRPEQGAKRGSSAGQQGQGVQRPVRMHAHAVNKV